MRLAAAFIATGFAFPASAADVDFTRDVRPILVGKCYQCHGPDDKVRKAGLRLDTRDGALRVLSPGDVAKSELLKRMTHADAAKRMPPAKVGKPSSEAEVITLKRWIEHLRIPSSPKN